MAHLIVNGKKIRVTAEKDPANLKWSEVGAEIVIESTGLFLTQADGQKHITAGAKKVVFSAPAKDDTPTFVMGVNHKKLNRAAYDRFKRFLYNKLPCSDCESSKR